MESLMSAWEGAAFGLSPHLCIGAGLAGVAFLFAILFWRQKGRELGLKNELDQALRELDELRNDFALIQRELAQADRAPEAVVRTFSLRLQDVSRRLCEHAQSGSVEARLAIQWVEQELHDLLESVELMAVLHEPAGPPLQREELRFHEVVSELPETIRGLAADRNVRLELAVPDTLPPIYAEAAPIRRVLQILLTRVLSSAPAGSAVRLRAEQARQAPAGQAMAGAFLEVVLEDDGPALPEMLEKLFREPASSEAGRAGSEQRQLQALPRECLEMAAAGWILRMHGAQWSLAAIPGGGKKIRLLLPLFNPLKASEDHFLQMAGAADHGASRVGLIVVHCGTDGSHAEAVCKRVASCLRAGLRKADWIIPLPDDRQVVILAQLTAGQPPTLLGRIWELVRREGQARSLMAMAVYPTDATTFEKLLLLARHRLESAEPIGNISPRDRPKPWAG